MARITLPLASISFFQCHRSTLVVIPLECSLGHIFKRLIRNFQILAQNLATLFDAIDTSSLQIREVDKLHILTTRRPKRSRLRSNLKNGLTSSIHNFDIAASIDQCEFFRVCSTVTNLVDISRRSRRSRSKRKRHSGKRDILF